MYVPSITQRLSWKFLPVNQINQRSWVTVVTQTDNPERKQQLQQQQNSHLHLPEKMLHINHAGILLRRFMIEISSIVSLYAQTNQLS